MEWKKTLCLGMMVSCCSATPLAWAASQSSMPAPKKMPRWTEIAQKYPSAYDKKTTEGIVTEKELAAYWQLFGDKTLDRLMEDAFQNNRDLKAAQARVEEARAQLGMKQAEQLPWLNAGGGWGRGEIPENVIQRPLQQMAPQPGMLREPKRVEQMTALGIDASWEPDLFGRIKEGKKAAAHDLAAQQAALGSTWVTLSGDVALNYISLRVLQQDLALVQQHAMLEGEQSSLWESRFAAGLSSAAPLESMRSQEQNTRAEIPALQQSIQETLTRLSILTGKEPGALQEYLQPAPLPEVNPLLYHAVPAETLRQRPDIRAAEEQLLGQVARSKQARAELKPRFTLSGFLGLLTLGGGNPFSSGARLFGFSPSLTLPLFHGGQLRQNVKFQDARVRELQAQYENTVLKAAGEVQDAMTSIVQENERKHRFLQGTENAESAYTLARNRYEAGLSDYLPVLDSERTLLSVKRQENRSRGQELADLIHLFKALGGGWQMFEEQTKEGNH